MFAEKYVYGCIDGVKRKKLARGKKGEKKGENKGEKEKKNVKVIDSPR